MRNIAVVPYLASCRPLFKEYRILRVPCLYILNIAVVPYLASCRPLFKEYRILRVPCLYILYLLVLIRKDIDKINTNNFNHNYSTRHGTDLMTPSHRLTLSESNPMYAGIALYNKLPRKDEHRAV
ncbi:hypothetical protein QE152_g22693 [Popillia japonica]|uniref:Uncharacterized protein n=1 Tax=Popillia japonica TaxID=7064 RepID=A0AAW1KJH0_POPJA